MSLSSAFFQLAARVKFLSWGRTFVAAFTSVILAAACFDGHAIAGPQGLPDPRATLTSLENHVHRVAVFGKDTRQRLSTSQRKMGARIGLLYDRKANSVCTAFCVAPDIVATASHCFAPQPGQTNRRLNQFVFDLRIRGSRLPARIAGIRQNLTELNVTTGSDRLRLSPPIDASNDWAFVRLSRNICRFGTLKFSRKTPLEVRQLAAKKKIYQVAFHRDIANWKLAIGKACPIKKSFPGTTWKTIRRDFRNSEALILHKCDTAGASSGSPLLYDGPDGPEVVAINVGTYLRAKMMMKPNGRVKKLDTKTVANTAVLAAPLRQYLKNFIETPVLSTRAQLREMQKHLKLRGFYRGKIDGVYGRQTRASIEAYQRLLGLQATGLASLDVLRILRRQLDDHNEDSLYTTTGETKRLPWRSKHTPLNHHTR